MKKTTSKIKKPNGAKPIVVRSLLEVKSEIAQRYGKTWEAIQRDYEYGMGISKLIGFEELMDIVAEEYKKQ